MRRTLLLTLFLFMTTGVVSSSPYYSFEYIHYDIMRAKKIGGRIYEVAVVSVDSIRTVKVFHSGKIGTGEYRDSSQGMHPLPRTQYLAKFEVIRNVAGPPHSREVPLFAIDTRSFAEFIWKKAWPAEKRVGMPFILVLDRNGTIRASYPARSPFNLSDEIELKRRNYFLSEFQDLLKNKEYFEFIHQKELIQILRREKFPVE